jgi:hypothetical protein
MGGFNEVFGSNPVCMIHIASSCTLVDIFHRRIGTSNFATFVGGRSGIDYVLMSQNAASALRHGGYEPPDFRFKGDRRAFFLDFDTNTLFGNIAPVMSPSAFRNLVSNERQNCARYVHAKYAYLLEHHWFQRMSYLTQNSHPDHRLAESLDRDWLRASLHAENNCTNSKMLANMWLRRSALGSIINVFKRRRHLDRAYTHVGASTSAALPQTLAGCEAEHEQLNSRLKQFEKDAALIRKGEQ